MCNIVFWGNMVREKEELLNAKYCPEFKHHICAEKLSEVQRDRTLRKFIIAHNRVEAA